MAIAFDASVGKGYNTTTTWSHTVTSGSDLALVVGVCNYTGAGRVTGITYNGVALTKGVEDSVPGFAETAGAWYLLSPSTGSNSIVVSIGGDNFFAISASYTGVAQSGQPDATSSHGQTTGTTIQSDITTVADNSWVVAVAVSQRSLTSNTGTTERETATHAQLYYGDSNGAVTPAGSQTEIINVSESTRTVMVVMSIAPAAAASTATTTPTMLTLGVG